MQLGESAWYNQLQSAYYYNDSHRRLGSYAREIIEKHALQIAKETGRLRGKHLKPPGRSGSGPGWPSWTCPWSTGPGIYSPFAGRPYDQI